MPAAEVLDRAADLVTAVGLERGELWPGSELTRLTYEHGQPVCMVGAVCVVRGATRRHETNDLIFRGDPALVALMDALDVEDVCDVMAFSDSVGWWLRHTRLRSWWRRRVVVATLRRAARLSRGA